MKITLKDGSFKEYNSEMAVIDIAADISEGLAGQRVLQKLMAGLLICVL